MNTNLSKRTALALAAVLATTVLTGGAAVFGLSHPAVTHAAAAPVVLQQAPVPAAQHWEEGGDR